MTLSVFDRTNSQHTAIDDFKSSANYGFGPFSIGAKVDIKKQSSDESSNVT